MKKGMTFRQAYNKMLEGKKIKRPSFQGYWFIDSFSCKLVIHDRYGQEFAEGDFMLTVVNILANDWEVKED